MRWLRGLGALVTLGLVLVGAPFVLVAWGRFPSGWDSLARPDDGSLLLGVLTVAGWLAWVSFAASTLVEAVRLGDHEHRRRLRIPLLGGLQQLSAGLLLAVLALAPDAPAAPGPGAVPVLVAEPEPDRPELAEPIATSGNTYLVEPGDDLWSISAQLLGDGARWRELAATNPDHLHDPTVRLAPGTRLDLPASAARRTLRVTVQRGDTLSGLALEHLGAASRWPRIAAANLDLVKNPDHIEIGWRLEIPRAIAAAHEAVERSRAHREQTDDHAQGRATTPMPDPETGIQPTTRPTARATPDTPAPSARQSPSGSAGPASQAEESATARTTAEVAADATRPAFPLLGTLGSLAAAAIIGVVETRRFLRLRERPVGRRLIPPEEDAARLRLALGVRQQPDRLAVLDASLRAIGRHCHQRGVPLPELARIVVGETAIAFEWATATTLPPVGFTGTHDRWTASLAEPPAADDHPCPYPAVVSLGSTSGGDLVLVDAERSRVLGVATDDPELRRSTLAAMGVELACAPWSAEISLLAVGTDAPLVALAGGDRVQVVERIEDAIERLRHVVAERSESLGAEALASLRVDPDRADAVAPVVLCVLEDVPVERATELDELLGGPSVGVAVILATASQADAQWQVEGDVAAPTGHLAGQSDRLLAHAIPEATRSGVARLFRAADDPASAVAPWWSGHEFGERRDNVLALPQRAHRGEDPVDIVRLVSAAEHPRVLLIGPADLQGANGPEPTRARQQLVELCAWLVEHPGSTATAMAAGLAVAEGTRRSNLSRLRAWLGNAPDGKPYLPDAYSGRVLLHPAITSDWHQLQLLLRPGIDRVGDSTLVAALEMVRGAPLADAAPSQWHWAEELRTDLSSALRDVGVVLTDRALARGDIDLARWAAARALAVAPEDEQLLCARIRTEHRAGNPTEVERLVNQVTRQARVLGVDLLPETVELCQQVVEGRLRARA